MVCCGCCRWRSSAPAPVRRRAELRFGIDRAAGRGMLEWCGSGAFAVDEATPAAAEGLLFDGRDLGRGLGVCAAWQTRMTPASVRAAILDYLRTGRRPRGVEWATTNTSVPLDRQRPHRR